jgi:transposase-like protein
MITCPRCGMEAQLTGKEWKYGVFDVKSYYCKQCKKKFNAYYRNDELRYTIPKSPSK